MLRLVLLASLSMLSGCSCDALWGSYEVPCTRGFDCPDAAMPGGVDMATGGDDRDLAMEGGGDGPTSPGDMRSSDMGPNMGDMRMPLPDFGFDLGLLNDFSAKETELGVIIVK